MESKALTCLVSFGFMFFCSFDDDVCDFVAEESAEEAGETCGIPCDEREQITHNNAASPIL